MPAQSSVATNLPGADLNSPASPKGEGQDARNKAMWDTTFRRLGNCPVSVPDSTLPPTYCRRPIRRTAASPKSAYCWCPTTAHPCAYRNEQW
jgi:hypothetical protein